MILVTGATGNVGRQIVEQLVAAGEPVRALSRHPERADWPAGVEGVAGDLTEGVAAEAFEGVRALHLFPVPDRAAETLTLAEAAGVEHVTVLSSLAAELDDDSPLRRRHTDVEDAAETSGLTWTHLRPGMFMANTLQWADAIKSTGVVRQPYAEWTAAPIHEADIADVAVAALLDPGQHAGAKYALTGDEPLSQVDRVRIMSEVLGRQIRFEEQTRQEALADMLRNPWMTEQFANSLLDMMSASIGVRDDMVLPGVQHVSGRPPRSFATWVEDHRADFT